MLDLSEVGLGGTCTQDVYFNDLWRFGQLLSSNGITEFSKHPVIDFCQKEEWQEKFPVSFKLYKLFCVLPHSINEDAYNFFFIREKKEELKGYEESIIPAILTIKSMRLEQIKNIHLDFHASIVSKLKYYNPLITF